MPFIVVLWPSGMPGSIFTQSSTIDTIDYRMHLVFDLEVVCMWTSTKPAVLAFFVSYRAQAISDSTLKRKASYVLTEPFCVFVLTDMSDNLPTRANAKTLQRYPLAYYDLCLW